MFKKRRGIKLPYNKQGLIPIVAHIDRYIAPFKTGGVFERLAEMSVLVQANASFHTACSNMSILQDLTVQSTASTFMKPG